MPFIVAAIFRIFELMSSFVLLFQLLVTYWLSIINIPEGFLFLVVK